MIFQIVTLVATILALRFDGHQVWQVNVNNRTDLFLDLQENFLIDLWHSNHDNVRFSLAPENIPKIQAILNHYRLKKQILFYDLQELIDDNQKDASREQHPLLPTSPPFFQKYQKMEDINEYFDSLHEQYPMLVEKFEIGKTFNGRSIKGIIIHSKNTTSKKEFLFHGGIHAREWIGPATVTYMATQFLELYGSDPIVTSLVDSFSFHIIPVLNIDGYIYSHKENRMWRKNRQPNNIFCVGTDINRNWDSGWSLPGASSNPCSDAYYGSSPFSSPEAAAISSYIKSRGENLIGYIDYHAYSQLWMYPFGYDCNKKAKDFEKLDIVSKTAVKALRKVNDIRFAQGPICNVIYQASGSSVDWAYENGVTYSFAVELRDTGRFGFLLPPRLIVPSGEEMFQAYLSMILEIKNQESL